MTCGCGCGARSSVSALSRRRLRGLTRSRYRSIGASAAATVAEQFDLSQYVPPDIASDAATAADYYNQFQNAAAGVSIVNGRLELSDAASQAVLEGMVAALNSVPVIGLALDLILALGPKAGAGPGVCATDPPSVPPGTAPTLAQLQAWPHFQSWASFNGAYPVAAPGSFEAFANPVLEFNWLLHANCFAQLYTPPAVVLATLIAAWNATHQATSTRSVCRSFQHITSFGTNAGYDPIADALYWSIVGDPKFQGPATDWTGPQYNGPDTASRCFSVNTGATIVRIKPLTFKGATPAQLALSNAGASIAKATAPKTSGAATVAVLGLAGAAVFYASRMGWLARWLR
jgi:hypothetical protein